jgi:catechol 2,3-dioxygenase-like lactoylglutathione lyase family enzyme
MKVCVMTENIRFEGLSLPVSDVAQSVAFYQQLGFQVEQSGPAFALLRLGEGTLGLLRAKLPEETLKLRQRVHIELSTDHLDKLYSELQTQGIQFSDPPHDEPWERAMAMPDPDGYHVEIAEGRRGKNAPDSRG